MTVEKRLSLCMVTKNDEKQLSDCLKDFSGIVDEIIIADIGSSDKTVEIAEQAGAIVYRMEWKNNYSEARNLCLDHAEGRWILFLDPDETILLEQLIELESLLVNPNVEGYLLYTSYPEDNSIFYPIQSLRLFRNRNEYRYRYKVFERIPDYILTNIEDSYIQIVKRDHGTPTRVPDIDILLLEEDISEHPEDSYLQYMYGIVLLNLQRYEESVTHFQKALQNANFDYLFTPHLFKCLSWSYIYLQWHLEALSVLEEGTKAFPFYSDLLVLRGELRMQLGQFKDAIRDLEGSLKIREQPNFTLPAAEIDATVILEMLGDIHEQVFNYHQALICYHKAFELDGTNQDLLNKINEMSVKTDSFTTVESLAKAAVKKIPHNDAQSAKKQKVLKQLLRGNYADIVRKLMEPGIFQPLGALEYVLWSKIFIKELESWIGRVCDGAINTGSAAALTSQVTEKPDIALLKLYNCLDIADNNMRESLSNNMANKMTNIEMYMGIGQCYSKSQKTREAISAYLRILQLDPMNESAQDELWDFAREDPGFYNDFLEKQEWISEDSRFKNKQEFIQYVFGLIHFKNQQFGEASTYFSKIVEDLNGYPVASSYIISSLWIEGRETEAECQLAKQSNTTEHLSIISRICKNYVLHRLDEGYQLYPYSELITEEKKRLCGG